MSATSLDKALKSLYDFNLVHHDLYRLTTKFKVVWRSAGPCCAVWRCCFGKPEDQSLVNVSKVYADVINNSQEDLSIKRIEHLQAAYSILYDLTRRCQTLPVAHDLAAACRKIENAIKDGDRNTVLTIPKRLHETIHTQTIESEVDPNGIGLDDIF